MDSSSDFAPCTECGPKNWLLILARLFWFLPAFGSDLEEYTKRKSAAAIFAGNTIAGLRPDSRWMAYEFPCWGQE